MELFDRADELFELFDKNGDGYISRGEFIEVVEILIGETGKSVSRPYFLQTDSNSDGKISYSEFVGLLNKLDMGT